MKYVTDQSSDVTVYVIVSATRHDTSVLEKIFNSVFENVSTISVLIDNRATTSNCMRPWSSTSWNVSQLVHVEVYIENMQLLLIEVLIV